ncbi:hypothetical protein [Nocardioides abyssi]|uniref:Integrase catalytic domain-containing protein n=1 Tax=Nocardioides abyssi TaxID=3058370 RepID=A0ABT8ESJ0_9ACTN|nr:hypothetical protein [Nocardioides abyssi]MDN4161128.1 hypothetical protein [Nocardioides abyssi]
MSGVWRERGQVETGSVATRVHEHGPKPTLRPEVKEAVLQTLVKRKAEQGSISARDVRDAARVLDCAPRTIWRWVAAGKVPTGERGRWTPTSEDFKKRAGKTFEELLLQHGSIAEVRFQLNKQGNAPVSTRTMQRAVARTMPTWDVVYRTKGAEAARGLLPTSRMPDLGVNDEWSTDDTQLPLWCVLPNGSIGKAQLQGVMDGRSRYILSTLILPFIINTEDAVENIANAVQGHYTTNGVFVGGKPKRLRTDRGSNFTAEATSKGLVEYGVNRVHSAPYTPEQNGKIERWHQFKGRLKHLPGFDWNEWKRNDKRKASEPPSRDGLLTFEELQVEVLKAVREHNVERVHSAHGMTPEACWEQEVSLHPDAVVLADSASIRAAMRQTDTRVLRRQRIAYDKKFYNLHPQSVAGGADEDPDVIKKRARLGMAAEGQKVTLRFLHGRAEYLSVYNRHNEYLGDAVWDELQTVAQAGQTAQRRREAIKVMEATIENIAVANVAAVAARRAEALAAAEPGKEQYDAYDQPDNDRTDETRGSGDSSDGSTPADGGEYEGGAGPVEAAAAAGIAIRKSRTARTKSAAAAGAAKPPTRAEQLKEQERKDAIAAATWTRRPA